MAVVTHLFRRRPPVVGVVAASFLLALVCAVCSINTVNLLPPKLAKRQLQTAGAATSVLIDLPRSMVADPRPTWNFEFYYALVRRGAMLAQLMASQPVLQYIGLHAGVSADQIAAVAPVTVAEPTELVDPGSEQRAWQILLSRDRYRLEIQSRIDAPIIDIYSQAPSPAAAERLGDAAIAGLTDYLRVLAVRQGVDAASPFGLEQLGPARGGIMNSGAASKIASLTFLFVFALSCTALLALVRYLPRRTRGAARRPDPANGLHIPHRPHRLALAADGLSSSDGNWPRTTRVMPWMLAVFMAILWLVPFDSIALKASLPIDLKFDRLVLPIIVLTWVLLLAAGGRNAPRIRSTKIHVAVGIFIALAFLSVLVNATALNQSLELDASVKQLPLLLAYLSLFFMVSSVLRRSEVRSFLTYTLVLAVICAIGMIVEYKTQYNVFFDLAGKLLPGAFTVASSAFGYDTGGRVMTHGPAMHGLAAASMLSMALPIAVVRLMQAKRPRDRLLYGLAAGVLIVGVFSTQKKTGLIAPVAALLTLCYFRRRELLKMAPLAAVVLIAVLIVSPGTVDPVIKQFSPSQLGGGAPATTSDRAARYDAIRPDVWTHLVLGRGYGTYQPTFGHRILDSEILLRLIEMGVLGLAAYFLLGASVVATARSTIISRHPTRAPPALIGAAAAVVFLVVGALFDSMSYPQVTYIFLYLAALVAVVVKPPDGDPLGGHQALAVRPRPRLRTHTLEASRSRSYTEPRSSR